MKFYFCETCGKRVTEDELKQQEAFDKQVKGVYCKSCAVGVNTETFDAIQIPEAQQPLASRGVSASKIRPPATSKVTRVATGVQARLRNPAPAPAAGQRSAEKSRMPLIVGGAALGVALVGGLIVYAMSGTPHPSERPVETAEVKDKPATPTSRPAAPVEAPQPAAPVASVETPAPSKSAQVLEDRAGAAFSILRQALAKADPAKKDEQIALLESFLKDFADSDLGPRARVMLSNLRSPPPPPAPAAAIEPVAPAALPIPQGGRELFNGKDLTGWTLRPEDGACRVENGEMIFAADKSCSAMTPIPSKDFTLIIEMFMDDDSGSYVELETRLGKVCINRGSAGQWLTIQIVVKGNECEAKLLKGPGQINKEPGEAPDHFRFHAMLGGNKHVKSVRLLPAGP